MTDGDRKPIYTVDAMPTLKAFGISSLILFFFALIVTIFIMVTVDFWLGLLCEVLFIMGGFVGRDIECRHHKVVLGHMTPSFQKMYKDIDYALAQSDVDEAKKQKEKK